MAQTNQSANVPPAPNYQSPSSPTPPAPGGQPPSGGGGMSKQTLIIIIVVIAVVGAAVAGFLIWWGNRPVDVQQPQQQTEDTSGVRSTQKTQPTSTPAPTTTAAPTPTPNEATLDHDRDGYSPAQGDCDDYDETLNPGQAELCDDGVDNDCDGYVDEDCGTYYNSNYDPAVFDYSPYFVYADEYIYDWLPFDSDFDGEDEVMVVGYSPADDMYHAFVLDWDPAFAVYMMDYETSFVPPFAYVTTNDWDGDGDYEFIVAFVADSGDGMAVLYDPYLDTYSEMYSWY